MRRIDISGTHFVSEYMEYLQYGTQCPAFK